MIRLLFSSIPYHQVLEQLLVFFLYSSLRTLSLGFGNCLEREESVDYM